MMPKWRHEKCEQPVRLTRCFVAAALQPGEILTLPAGASAHIGRVLRGRPGSALTLFNGQGGEFEARIMSVERRGVQVRIGAHQAVECESPLHITLLQAIARGERMDLIVQKATELGVAAMVIWTSVRSVVRPDAEGQRKRQEHWQGVIASACEQCGRNRLPTLRLAQELGSAVALSGDGRRLLLTPEGPESLAAQAQHPGHVTLLLGPEGGFAPEELSLAHTLGFIGCRLGPRVLRAETAPLAALTVLQALAGDLKS
jgi:16S rRNA (uracil1498-N3)-methyltransferase